MNNLPDNPDIEVEKLSKCNGLFTNYIYKTIPLAFDESMSYYETLCGLLQYLQNTIMPTINNNADALQELQNFCVELKDYVDNYFTNLDVQDEINNKLDAMVEDGTLAELIDNYLLVNSIYLNTSQDITSVINGLSDGTTLFLGNTTFTVNGAELTADNISIIGQGAIITNLSTGSAITITGDNTIIRNLKIVNTENWYPETSVDLYGSLELIGNNIYVSDLEMINVNKSGIYIEGDGTIENCSIFANLPDNMYTTASANNQLYCIYLKNSNNSIDIFINNCKMYQSIEGVYFGDYYYNINTVGVHVNNCYFENMIDHAIYLNGGYGNSATNNTCKYCNHAITMLGQYHNIDNNTILLNANRLEVTGVSLREPKFCKITNNIISGEGATNTAGIDITNLSGDPSPNTSIDNILISGNIFETTGNITPLRIGRNGQTTSVNNITINNNIIDCENYSQKIIISFQINNNKNININNNKITCHGAGNIIYLSGTDVKINYNDIIYKDFDSISSVNINVVNGEIKGIISNNSVTTDNDETTTVNCRLFRVVGDSNVILTNNIMDTKITMMNYISTGGHIYANNNFSNNTPSEGTLTTTATGAYTIVNTNYILNQSNILLFATDSTSAGFLKNGYTISGVNQGRCNIQVLDTNQAITLKYVIC